MRSFAAQRLWVEARRQVHTLQLEFSGIPLRDPRTFGDWEPATDTGSNPWKLELPPYDPPETCFAQPEPQN